MKVLKFDDKYRLNFFCENKRVKTIHSEELFYFDKMRSRTIFVHVKLQDVARASLQCLKMYS